MIGTTGNPEKPRTGAKPRNRALGRVVVVAIPLIAALAILNLTLLRSKEAPADGSYVDKPLPGRWTFPKRPDRATTHPILAKFKRDWGHPVTTLAEVSPVAWKARMTALCELARLGPEAVPALLQGLDDEEPEVRNLSAQAMGYLGDSSQAARLERVMTEDPDGAVRIYAALSRAMIGGPIPASLAEQVAKHDPVRMAKTRLDLAMQREPEPRSEAIREALAGFNLQQMDTARLGQPAPDFALTDQNGRQHRLSDYRGKKAVVLVFLYGVTCMHCYGQVAQIRGKLAEFRDRGAEVLMVESHEPYRVRSTLREASHDPKDTARLPVLSDPSHTVAASYGVAMQMHHVEWLNRPSSFIIDRDGILRYAYLGRRVDDRPSPGDLLAEVEKLHDPSPARRGRSSDQAD